MTLDALDLEIEILVNCVEFEKQIDLLFGFLPFSSNFRIQFPLVRYDRETL